MDINNLLSNNNNKVFMLLLLLISFLVSHTTQAKVLIFTYSYNRPDFIEIQHRTFKKFLKDEYEFVVFNDARDPQLYQAIIATCNKLNVRCIPIPQEIHDKPYLQRLPGEGYHDSAVRNCNVVMYSLDNYGFNHDDIVVLLDSDMFLVKPLSIRNYMKNYNLAGLYQHRDPDIKYLWIGIAFLDMHTMPNKKTINFNCGRIDNVPVDAGGQTHYYLKNNPTAQVKAIDVVHLNNFACDACNNQKNTAVCTHNTESLRTQHFNNNFISFIQSGPPAGYYHEAYMEFLLDQTFLHYRSATNWDHKSSEYHTYKTKILNDYIDAITH